MLICQYAEGVHGQKNWGTPVLDNLVSTCLTHSIEAKSLVELLQNAWTTSRSWSRRTGSTCASRAPLKPSKRSLRTSATETRRFARRRWTRSSPRTTCPEASSWNKSEGWVLSLPMCWLCLYLRDWRFGLNPGFTSSRGRLRWTLSSRVAPLSDYSVVVGRSANFFDWEANQGCGAGAKNF